MVKVIVGNKSDVEDRKIKIQDAKKYASSKGIEFFETSALLNDGSVNDVFSSLAMALRRTFKDNELTAL